MALTIRPFRFALAAIAAALAVSFANLPEASAGRTHVALDLDWASADQGDSPSGFGGALRLGYEIDAALVSVIPEFGLGYLSFSDAEAKVYRGVLGGRLRFLKLVEPGIYAHFGVGHGDIDVLEGQSWTAGTMDAGLLLDVTLLPMFEFGAHGGYNSLFSSGDIDALKWWSVGLHAAVVF